LEITIIHSLTLWFKKLDPIIFSKLFDINKFSPISIIYVERINKKNPIQLLAKTEKRLRFSTTIIYVIRVASSNQTKIMIF